jgi:Flp pilus assembly protein TadB
MLEAEIVTLVALVGAAALIFSLWLNVRLQNVSRHRLDRALQAGATTEAPFEEPMPARPFLRRRRVLPWLIGVVAGAALWFVARLLPIYCATASLIVGLIGWQIESWRAERRRLLIETQLADAIDLMVGALRAGAGLTGALENAAAESRAPLAEQLDEVIGRIRFGDAPQSVFRSLADRVPLETFVLFTSALSVHWETGGSLAPTLATVGRTIRDRIELTRRIRAMSTQSRVSILSVLGVTYFIALLMWRNDPGRMEAFLGTSLGSFFVAGAVFLQSLGILWSAAISRARF